MGTQVIGLQRCTCLQKKVSSFILSTAKLSNAANFLPKEECRSSLLTVSPNKVLNRRVQEVKQNSCFRLHRNLPYYHIRDLTTSTQLERFNEPLQPIEGTSPNICWNCKADFALEYEKNKLNNLLTCSQCSVLRLIPKDINYFELFGIPRKFKMDLKKLAQKYKSMQRILHPDR